MTDRTEYMQILRADIEKFLQNVKNEMIQTFRELDTSFYGTKTAMETGMEKIVTIAQSKAYLHL